MRENLLAGESLRHRSGIQLGLEVPAQNSWNPMVRLSIQQINGPNNFETEIEASKTVLELKTQIGGRVMLQVFLLTSSYVQ